MTTRLPHGDEAVLDIRKIEDYCLSPSHPRGGTRLGYSARRSTFSAATRHGCEMFCLKRLAPARPLRCRGRLGDPLAPRCAHQATRKECCGKNDLDRANRRERAEVRHVLGVMMKAKNAAKNERPSVLDVVALLTGLPAQQLARGQVGTIVEELDDKTLLVEFSDDQGRAYAIAPCPRADLLVLHYVLEAA
jgi:hypothetical protein